MELDTGLDSDLEYTPGALGAYIGGVVPVALERYLRIGRGTASSKWSKVIVLESSHPSESDHLSFEPLDFQKLAPFRLESALNALNVFQAC